MRRYQRPRTIRLSRREPLRMPTRAAPAKGRGSCPITFSTAIDGYALGLPASVALAQRASRVALLAAPVHHAAALFFAGVLERTEQLVPFEPAGVQHRARGEFQGPDELDAGFARVDDLDRVLVVVVEEVDQLVSRTRQLYRLGRGLGLALVEGVPGAVHIAGRRAAREEDAACRVLPVSFDRLVPVRLLHFRGRLGKGRAGQPEQDEQEAGKRSHR